LFCFAAEKLRKSVCFPNKTNLYDVTFVFSVLQDLENETQYFLVMLPTENAMALAIKSRRWRFEVGSHTIVLWPLQNTIVIVRRTSHRVPQSQWRAFNNTFMRAKTVLLLLAFPDNFLGCKRRTFR
jgi:hypothetical protein